MSSIGYPPPDVMHGNLISAIHEAILAHPHPEYKATYSKLLQPLLTLQAKAHATGTPSGGYGGNQGDVAGGPVAQQAPANTDAQGLAGASAILSALFPPANYQTTSPLAAALAFGARNQGLPAAQAPVMHPAGLAALGHRAVY